MFQRILVPVDGSKTAEAALEFACRLAIEQRAKLRLVHVVDESMIAFSFQGAAPDFDALRKAFSEGGANILARAKDRAAAAGIGAETELVEMMGGRAASMIVGQASTWPADLIVMGTHGRTGFNHLLLGSVAEGVVRTATVPVLLTRGR